MGVDHRDRGLLPLSIESVRDPGDEAAGILGSDIGTNRHGVLLRWQPRLRDADVGMGHAWLHTGYRGLQGLVVGICRRSGHDAGNTVAIDRKGGPLLAPQRRRQPSATNRRM
jgi:hypothetical protein